MQWFERNRLELHPENARPYDVLLGRLGADRLAQQGRDPFTFAKSSTQAGCRYFPETQHNVCGDVLSAWHASGLEFDGKKGKSEAENLAWNVTARRRTAFAFAWENFHRRVADYSGGTIPL